MAGGDEGPIVVVGKSAESRLIHSVARTDPDYPMPPEGQGDPLTPAEVGLLRAWIDQGAKWSADAADSTQTVAIKSDHWSFQAPKRSDPPAVNRADWARNPIDRFILARLEKEGLRTVSRGRPADA